MCLVFFDYTFVCVSQKLNFKKNQSERHLLSLLTCVISISPLPISTHL